MSSILHTLNIESEICCACGTPFGIEAGLKRNLTNTHRSFYCPNGHAQSYVGETNEERLSKELTRLRSQKDQVDQELLNKNRALKKFESQKKRIKNGVCPCCNRTFLNLQSHMKTKHPEV